MKSFALLSALLLAPMARGEASGTVTHADSGSVLNPVDPSVPLPQILLRLPRDPDPSWRPPKSQAAAYSWAAGATLVPVAIALPLILRNGATDGNKVVGAIFLGSGLLVGPSAGQLYAGSENTAVAGMLIRGVGPGLSMLIEAIKVFDDPFYRCDSKCEASQIKTFAKFALVSFSIGTAYSLWDTHRAVNRANESARKAPVVKTSFAPALLPVGDGRLAPGLAFNARF
jgi:hypothetical protein